MPRPLASGKSPRGVHFGEMRTDRRNPVHGVADAASGTTALRLRIGPMQPALSVSATFCSAHRAIAAPPTAHHIMIEVLDHDEPTTPHEPRRLLAAQGPLAIRRQTSVPLQPCPRLSAAIRPLPPLRQAPLKDLVLPRVLNCTQIRPRSAIIRCRRPATGVDAHHAHEPTDCLLRRRLPHRQVQPVANWEERCRRSGSRSARSVWCLSAQASTTPTSIARAAPTPNAVPARMPRRKPGIVQPRQRLV